MSSEAIKIITRLREQAEVDDLVDLATFKRLKYLNNISDALSEIYNKFKKSEIHYQNKLKRSVCNQATKILTIKQFIEGKILKTKLLTFPNNYQKNPSTKRKG